jgi:hypothetical protein
VGFRLSVSFHQGSTIITTIIIIIIIIITIIITINLILILSEGRKGEKLETFKKQCSFGNWGASDRKVHLLEHYIWRQKVPPKRRNNPLLHKVNTKK